ncbi:hypothetical protein BKA81DRAFT_381131 [Phyllosticta paracitricarpa]
MLYSPQCLSPEIFPVVQATNLLPVRRESLKTIVGATAIECRRLGSILPSDPSVRLYQDACAASEKHWDHGAVRLSVSQQPLTSPAIARCASDMRRVTDQSDGATRWKKICRRVCNEAKRRREPGEAGDTARGEFVVAAGQTGQGRLWGKGKGAA